MIERRKFITLLGGAAAAWPLAARAQQPAMPVIGYFAAGSPERFADRIAAFREGLRKTGFVEGRNVAIEQRWSDAGFDSMPALAAELVAHKVDVLVTSNVPTIAKAATTSIPIVSLFPSDPVRSGLVASLNRPGGNLTGVAIFAFSLGPKRFELLRETVPSAKLMAVLANPKQLDPGSQADLADVEAAARALGQRIAIFNASTVADFEPTFAAMAAQGTDALLVMGDPFFNNNRERLIALAARLAIPAIWEWREMALAGGLMSYGTSLTDAFRLLGDYAGQVLKGAKPADLPVQQAVKIELVLNMKTAKALGVTFPITLLGRANEVIE
jgi:putative tryptophan/tyrosine transport system substrate-binding protein